MLFLEPRGLIEVQSWEEALPYLLRHSRVSLDVGGIIMDRDHQDRRIWRSDNYLATPWVSGAKAGIQTLLDQEVRVSIVARGVKALDTKQKTMAWFGQEGLFGMGIQPVDIHWCWLKPRKAPLISKIGAGVHFDDSKKCFIGVDDKVMKLLMRR